MFTIDQIRNAHSKVKSGADFPAYIQELKSLGIQAYEHMVGDGSIHYVGTDNFRLAAPPKWEARMISQTASADQLKQSLQVHQQGQSDYPTFCQQAAEAGVDKWIVDMEAMKCVYYDGKGNELLSEDIPE